MKGTSHPVFQASRSGCGIFGRRLTMARC
jgi:hypothetical protein